MKKPTPFNKPARMKLIHVLVSASVLGISLGGVALAEDKTWEIQSGNSLGKIIASEYPDYGNRKAIMQEILKRNPEAFINNDFNRLVVGKTLKLPAASEIPDLEPPPQPKETNKQASIDEATQAKLKALEAQVAEQKDTISMLEEENAGLQEMVTGFTETKPVTDTGADTEGLQQQLDSTKQELQASQDKVKSLDAQLASLKRENETLHNDLQQIQAAATIAESKDSGSSSLPWVLLGLLALLTVPLIWLLRRKQGSNVPPVPLPASVEPPAATPVAEAPLAVIPAPQPETVAAPAASPDSPDAGLKLDIARAYLDLRDSEAAADILQDVLMEGGEQQRREAREILSFIT